MLFSFLTGLLGSFHCLGMCAPFMMVLPSGSLKNNLLYQSGRIVTYGILGGVFGLLGNGLFIAGFQQKLSVLTGILILVTIFFPHFNIPFFNQVQIKIKQAFVPFLKAKNMFMIGILNGLLPCGLVYLAILEATTAATFWQGMVLMMIFGLGTLPMMMAAGILKGIISLKIPYYATRFIPVFAVVTSILFIIRGLNLNIPYLSPELEQTGAIIICHGK
jgi:hypothetical protein